MPTSESKALYRAGIQTCRTLETTSSLPDRTTSVGHLGGGGENKLIITKRKIYVVDTYPHQCSFHHRTWCFAKLGVVMDDNLRVWLAVR
jgi:hypothetical protein